MQENEERKQNIERESRVEKHQRSVVKNTIFVRFWRKYYVSRILLILVALFVFLTGSYLFYLAKTADVGDLESSLKNTTTIYDKENAEAGTIYGQKGTYVSSDAISPYLKKAVVATEDRTFYQNNGVNPLRFTLAVLTLGHFGGGSTITQQLAKNAYLTQEQSITRKAREFFLALEINKKYSKKKVLTMYLNNSYFGNGVWGVEDASQKYFGVSASQLTLDEAATLAGMLKGPGLYNPLYSIENATNRRDTVLQNMVNAGKISQSQANTSSKVKMASELKDTYVAKSDSYKYPSYFDAVINEAIDTYGLTEKEIVNNGYKIYTTLDQNYQSVMQATYDDDSLFPVSSYDNQSAQSASVAIDPKTGGVRALVGRVNSDEDAQFRSFNYASQSKRSPGSTIKPLVVYSPAVAKGWSLSKLLENSDHDYNGYSPHNYGNTTSAPVPMYQALAESLNLPAVYTVNKLGLSTAFSYGKKFGLDMSSVPKELGVALGSGVETNPLEMAQAYSTFANDGVMNKAHLITKIENADGKVIKKYKTQATRVLSKETSQKMTSMMLGTFSNGTGIYAAPYGYTMAGKTGTTSTDFDDNLTSDQWVIGYTSDVVISEWLGYAKTDKNHYLEGVSYGNASSIFKSEVSGILPYTEGTSFNISNAYLTGGSDDVVVSTSDGEEESDSSSSASSSVKRFSQTIKEKISDGWSYLKKRFD